MLYYKIVLHVFLILYLRKLTVGQEQNVLGNCSIIANKVTEIAGDAITCLNSHIVPAAYCGWCGHKLSELRNLLTNISITDEEGNSCINLITSSSKEPLDTLEFISNTWNHSLCSRCLLQSNSISPSHQFKQLQFMSNWPIYSIAETKSQSSKPIDKLYNLPVYNNHTKIFFEKLTSVLECLTNFLNLTDVSILEILSFPSSLHWNTTSPGCFNCSDGYKDLLDFYERHIMQVNSESANIWHEPLIHRNYHYAVCLDVQYALNRTQWAWFHVFKCQNRNKPWIGSLLPLIICLVLLILFHGIIKLVCKQPIYVQIYKPKRVEPRVTSSHRLLGGDNLTVIPSYASFESTSTVRNNLSESISSRRLQRPDRS